MFKYFSTFTGIGSIELAIEEILPNSKCIGYSEINKNAILIYNKHFPKHKNYGDISQININQLPDFDFLFGGSPCQDLSIANFKRKSLQGSKSSLFFKFLEILIVKKPKYFLLENVASMNDESIKTISNLLSCKPILLDAQYFSAQRRKRLFWCNFFIKPITKDIKNETIKDILQEVKETSKSRHICKSMLVKIKERKLKILMPTDKSNVCMVKQNRCPNAGMINDKYGLRFFTIQEYERLQCLPKNYTKGISKLQREEVIGNAINVNVARYIILNLKRQLEKNNEI